MYNPLDPFGLFSSLYEKPPESPTNLEILSVLPLLGLMYLTYEAKKENDPPKMRPFDPQTFFSSNKL